mmetsp:Transcript_56652/g.122442  ORF Transcript_56652/g.122442 Transcript_56652/m.122442 type:complete len:243 (-) Transcript_56652:55-783(-)
MEGLQSAVDSGSAGVACSGCFSQCTWRKTENVCVTSRQLGADILQAPCRAATLFGAIAEEHHSAASCRPRADSAASLALADDATQLLTPRWLEGLPIADAWPVQRQFFLNPWHAHASSWKRPSCGASTEICFHGPPVLGRRCLPAAAAAFWRMALAAGLRGRNRHGGHSGGGRPCATCLCAYISGASYSAPATWRQWLGPHQHPKSPAGAAGCLGDVVDAWHGFPHGGPGIQPGGQLQALTG